MRWGYQLRTLETTASGKQAVPGRMDRHIHIPDMNLLVDD